MFIFRFTQAGISLPGVLVAIGLISIVSLSVTQLATQSMNVTRMIETRQSANNLRLGIVGLLSNRQNCEASLNTRSPVDNANEPDRLVGSDGTVYLQRGNRYENNTVRVDRIYFETGRPAPQPANSYMRFNTVARRGSAELTVVTSSDGLQFGTAFTQTVRIKLIAELDVNDRILTCVAVGDNQDDIWKLNAAGEVYYEGGNVGIGPTMINPNFELDVQGTIRATGTIVSDTRIDAPVLAATGVNGKVIAREVLADAFLYTSDARLKTNLQSFDGLQILKNLQPKTFVWRQSQKDAVGFIAQELESVLPEAVKSDPETGYKSVDYSQVVTVLVRSAQQLYDKNSFLLERVQLLEQRLNKCQK